ncbi:beta-lactamase [Myxococcus stipitatus DSM 14675]|uniref:Beta-lactamase n=1 Tax=Myxococcus stipitatus (strain DSM 14675 / JCM 12634 / Mx s8) TaxID=1278073 RepID=L7U7A5_MYXSD|nr:serine hydrolase domain-containing protein [Myxococcus stipitatus]AGC43427.1 beta-lactamase [Myxococcus stipitatus DSM 14675]
MKTHPLVPRRCLLMLLLACTVTSACDDDPPARTPDYAELKKHVERELLLSMKQDEVRGVSLALVEGDEVVWSQGFGLADAEAGLPATAQTVYGLGSVAKVFTASAVMRLVEEKRATLDQPIEEVIPGFSMEARFPSAPITLRTLLMHHAGIPEQVGGAYSPRAHTLEERVASLRGVHRVWPVGSIHAYSNTGFVIAGRAVETASGSDFDTFLRQHVFAPLRMEHSAFRVTPDIGPRLAKGYGAMPLELMPPHWLRSEGPAGGMYSSAEDLGRFVRMLLNEGEQVLRPESLQELWREQNAGHPLDVGTRSGITWYLHDLPLEGGGTVRMVEHDGSDFQFNAIIALIPEHRLGVVVLSNTSSAGSLVNSLARDVLARALKVKTGKAVAAVSGLPTVQPEAPSPEVLGQWEGLYATDVGPMVIQAQGDTLKGLAGDTVLDLVPHQRGFFRAMLGDSPLWLSFQKSGSEALLLGHSARQGVGLLGTRIDPAPMPESWRARLGPYAVAPGAARELLDQAVLSEVGGLLVLTYTGPLYGGAPVTVVLDPMTGDLAAVAGRGRHRGDVVRFEQTSEGAWLHLKGVRLARVPTASAGHDL